MRKVFQDRRVPFIQLLGTKEDTVQLLSTRAFNGANTDQRFTSNDVEGPILRGRDYKPFITNNDEDPAQDDEKEQGDEQKGM